MDIWGFIIIIGGLGIITAIALNFLGITNALGVVSSFIGHFLSTVWSIFTNIVSSAPGFVKIIIFLMLFWIFGGFIFSVTLGFPYVCHPDSGNLYKGSIGDVILYNMYPSGALYADSIPSNDPYNITVRRPSGFLNLGRTKTTEKDNFHDLIFYGAPEEGDRNCPIPSSSCGSEVVGMYYTIPYKYEFEEIDGFISFDNPFDFRICYLPPGKWAPSGTVNSYDVTMSSCYFSDEPCNRHALRHFETAGGIVEELYRFTYELDNKNKDFQVLFQDKTNHDPNNEARHDLEDCHFLTDGDGSTTEDREAVYFGNEIYLKFDLVRDDGSIESLCSNNACPVYDRTIKTVGSPQEIVTRSDLTTAKTQFMQENFGTPPGTPYKTQAEQEGGDPEFFSFVCDENEDGTYSENESFRLLGIPIFDIKIIGILVALIAFFGLVRLIKGN